MKLNTKILKGLSQAKTGPISTLNDVIKAAEANRIRSKTISDIESGIKNAEKVYQDILNAKSDDERKEKIEELYEIYRENIFNPASKARIFLKLAKNGTMINGNKRDLMFGGEVGNLRYPKQENSVKVFMWRLVPNTLSLLSDFLLEFLLHPLRNISRAWIEKTQDAFTNKGVDTQCFTFKFEDIQAIDLIKRDGVNYLYIDVIETQYL